MLKTTRSVIGALAASGLVAGAAVPEQQPLQPEVLYDIPRLGFGTWNLKAPNASDAVKYAIHTGYRHIDAAAIYGNEKQTGAGIRAALLDEPLPREAIWVTSKLWNDMHKPKDVPKALDKTLSDLGLEYLDLYLMHWPVKKTHKGKIKIDFLETWDAMVALLNTGKVRHVGVSNFSPAQLDLLTTHSSVKPFAHQFEVHPYLPQTQFIEDQLAYGIRVTAYSPLGNTNPTYTSARKEMSASKVPPLLQNDVLKKIAETRGCTPAQAALAWGMRHTGVSVIPKATTVQHIEENYESQQCYLQPEDFEKLKHLPVKRFNNPSKGWGVQLYEGLQDSGASAIDKAVSAGLKVWDAMREGVSLCASAARKVVRPEHDL